MNEIIPFKFIKVLCFVSSWYRAANAAYQQTQAYGVPTAATGATTAASYSSQRSAYDAAYQTTATPVTYTGKFFVLFCALSFMFRNNNKYEKDTFWFILCRFHQHEVCSSLILFLHSAVSFDIQTNKNCSLFFYMK